jgi:TRAP-type C4-dicarboxylate transport system substrate-binding protein
MTDHPTRRAFAIAAGTGLLLPALGHGLRAAEGAFRLRCSLDTAPSHLKNVCIKDYLGKVEAASGGRIRCEIFESAQLYPDLEVGKALIQGQIEMAVPGSWTLTGIVPDADLFQLPVLYGRSIEHVHRVIDGKPGELLNRQIQQKLRSHVLGSYFDLGHYNWYSAGKPIATLADLKGMKIRNSGGAGQSWRARFVGAIPNTTAWPNVPLSLSQGTFDGLVSSNESLISAKLWEAGVKYAIEDHQFVAEYVPLVSQAFWDKLDSDLQNLMTETWAANVPAYRERSILAQREARKTLMQHGVSFVDPSDQEINETRGRMMAEQDQLAKDIKISPQMLQAVMAVAAGFV